MSNKRLVVGHARLTTHLPAAAALLLIERAVAADRSTSAYVADVLLASLHGRERSLPRNAGGRRPRCDVDVEATARRVLAGDAARMAKRAAQVTRQKKTAGGGA
jgi:hypothetical protein